MQPTKEVKEFGMSKKKSAAKAQVVEAVAQSTVNLDQLVSGIGQLDVLALQAVRAALIKQETELRMEKSALEQKQAKEADATFATTHKKLISAVKAARGKLETRANKLIGSTFSFETELTFKVDVVIDDIDVDAIDGSSDLDLGNIVQYSTHVTMVRPDDLTDEQRDVLSGVLDDIENTAVNSADGACADIFRLFPKFEKTQSEAMALAEAYQEAYQELEEVVSDHQTKYDFTNVDIYELTN